MVTYVIQVMMLLNNRSSVESSEHLFPGLWQVWSDVFNDIDPGTLSALLTIEALNKSVYDSLGRHSWSAVGLPFQVAVLP